MCGRPKRAKTYPAFVPQAPLPKISGKGKKLETMPTFRESDEQERFLRYVRRLTPVEMTFVQMVKAR